MVTEDQMAAQADEEQVRRDAVTVRVTEHQLYQGEEVSWVVEDDGKHSPAPAGTLVLFDNGTVQRVGVVSDASYVDSRLPRWEVWGVVLRVNDSDHDTLFWML